MIKSAYRAFSQECYLVIDLMRQFYDEQRVFRVTGSSGQNQFVTFSGAMLRAPAAQQIGGVVLGGREPVFDITISAAKKSTFSKLSQNETAKECYQLGFFNPANADAALAALEMMDFEGIEKVRDRVQQNGTLLQQLQQANQLIMQLSARIDMLTAGAAGVSNAGGRRGERQPTEGRGRAPWQRRQQDGHQRPGPGSGKQCRPAGDSGGHPSHERDKPQQGVDITGGNG